MRRACHALIATLLLIACAGPEKAGQRLDPRQADYGSLRLFVALPEGLETRDGMPALNITAQTTGASPRVITLRTAPVADPRARPEETAHGIVAADLPAFRALLSETVGSGSSGRYDVEITLRTCHTGPVGAGPVTIRLAGPSDPRPLTLFPAPGGGPRVLSDHASAGPCP